MATNQGNLVRIEFKLRADDAALLARVAQLRGCAVSELIRRSLYETIQPLVNAQHERELRTAREVEDARRLREWIGRKPQSSDYDPAAPERYAPWQEE